jgi:hypothetical protein
LGELDAPEGGAEAHIRFASQTNAPKRFYTDNLMLAVATSRQNVLNRQRTDIVADAIFFCG